MNDLSFMKKFFENVMILSIFDQFFFKFLHL